MVKEIVETFNIGASYTIGSYILPGEKLNRISNIVNQKIKLDITSCDKIINGLIEKRFRLGLIENPIFNRRLKYKEWLRDELVICSKIPLPKEISKMELKNFNLITRDDSSPTKQTILKFLKRVGVGFEDFKSTIQADNPTTLIQGVKWSRPNRKNPTISIISKIAIEDEIARDELYISRIKDLKMERSFYLVYNQDEFEDFNISKIIQTL